MHCNANIDIVQPVPYQPNSAAPKMLTGPPMVIYKQNFDVMLYLEAEWTSKQIF